MPVRAVSPAIGEGMSVTIKQNRRHFLGTVVMTFAGTQLARFGSVKGLASAAWPQRPTQAPQPG